MAARRWGVIDDNGIVVNLIVIEDPMPAAYYPGYGTRLVDQGPAPRQTTNPNSVLPVVSATPTLPLQIGDFLNVNTGQVFRYVPNQIQQVQQDGSTITVSSAPQVVLKKAGT